MATQQLAKPDVQSVSLKQKRKQDAEDLAQLLYDMFVEAEINSSNEED